MTFNFSESKNNNYPISENDPIFMIPLLFPNYIFLEYTTILLEYYTLT